MSLHGRVKAVSKSNCSPKSGHSGGLAHASTIQIERLHRVAGYGRFPPKSTNTAIQAGESKQQGLATTTKTRPQAKLAVPSAPARCVPPGTFSGQVFSSARSRKCASASASGCRDFGRISTTCQAAMNPGNLDAFTSNVAVARHPSRRFWVPIRQSAKSAVVSFQMKRASSMAGSSSNRTSVASSKPEMASMIRCFGRLYRLRRPIRFPGGPSWLTKTRRPAAISRLISLRAFSN
jgi:hypothetical protein